MSTLRQPNSPVGNLSLSSLIAAAPSPAQAVAWMGEALSGAGSIQLDPAKTWPLEPGASYHLSYSQRSLFAFRMPHSGLASFRLIGAHTDSPCFRLRHRAAHWDGAWLATGTEAYGGVINHTWFDRLLRVAGTAVVRQPDGTQHELSIELLGIQPLIPSLAIHLNRDINKGFEFNPHSQLRALVGVEVPHDQRERPWEFMAAQSLTQTTGQAVAASDIQALDLYLSDAQDPVEFGAGQRLINAPRLDNLAGCHAAVQAFIAAAPVAGQAQVISLFDHEEIGSHSQAGADSGRINRLLRRIALAGGMAGEEAFQIALEHSWQASVDAAHARHPNFAEKHDPDYAPEINAGIALKTNVSQRYATTPAGFAKFVALCQAKGIPVQYFSNRADLACGSTIGPMLAASTGINTIDLGIPILAMHSCRETGGLRDQEWIIAALTAFLEEV